MQRFTTSFTRAVELLDRGRPRDLQDAAAALETCAALVEELPGRRRDQARFFVGVRQAELWFRSPNPEVHSRVLPRLLRIREQARSAGVYEGSYRVLLLVLGWQADPAWGRGLGDEEREFLLQEDLFDDELGRASYLHAPARVLRFELSVGTDRELEELRALHRLERELEAADGASAWHGKCLDALALYYVSRRDYERARLYVDRLGPERGRLARALLALQREDHAAAEAQARKVVEDGDDNGLLLLGDALESQGRYAEALESYDRFLAGDPGPSNRAAALNGRGDCLLGLGRHEDAERSYRSVLALAEPGTLGLRAEAAETWKDLGRLAERRGDPVSAWRAFWRALDLQEELRRGLHTDAFGGTWYAAHPDQLTAVDGMLRVAESAGADPWEVLAATERLKARSALDAARLGYTSGDRQAVRAVMDRLAAASSPAELRSLLLELGTLRAGIARERERPAAPLDGARLREFAAVRPDTLILTYWVGRETTWVLWTLRGSAPQAIRLGTTDAALRHTRQAFEAVLDPGADTEPLTAAAAWFLPEPVRSRSGMAADLLISPDTEIARLPFEALLLEGEPLGTSLAIERAPSLSVAQELQARAPAQGLPVVLHSARNAELEALLELEPLTFSEREAELVRGALGDRLSLSGRGASLAGLRATLNRAPSVLHLSAHAVDLPMAPSCSLLVLADGAVSMASLAALPLQGSLIVLSSCDSAVGELRRQEGVVGLVEGTMAAGARSVVASLYRVNQQATADLMGQFHHHLRGGATPAQALMRARRTLAESEHYAHPHYWAGFTVHGGWSPRRGGFAWWWLAAGAPLLLLLALWLRVRLRAS